MAQYTSVDKSDKEESSWNWFLIPRNMSQPSPTCPFAFRNVMIAAGSSLLCNPSLQKCDVESDQNWGQTASEGILMLFFELCDLDNICEPNLKVSLLVKFRDSAGLLTFV